jgi:DNA-binding response OmpR family regulator
VEAGQAAPGPGEHPRESGAAERGADGRAHVLVVDDDPGVRDLLTRFLTREGFRVTTAPGGDDGLHAASALRPDIITLDVLMPGKDGWAVLSALKASPDLAQIPVVMVSVVDGRQLSDALGAAEFIPKPVNWDKLAATLRRHTAAGEPAAGRAADDRSVLVVDPTTLNGQKEAG